MSHVLATYRVRAAPEDIARAAQALALEQSVEVPLDAVTDAFVESQILGRVGMITEIAPSLYDVRIRLAEITMGGDVAQTVNMLFGNSSLHDHVQLVDAEFPPGFSAALGGPRFGMPGLRRRLGVMGRPLACAAIKPQGLSVERLARLCETFARGGIDVIKDDHGLADQSYSPFLRRVRACQQALKRAVEETGRPALYAPSLVGAPRTLREYLKIVRDEGVGAVLIAPALIGMPVFHELVREEIDVPVLAHPSFAGATRVAPSWLLGKWFRMLGADAVIFPSFGGRFAYSETACRQIAEAARCPMDCLLPSLPVPAGGIAVERVPALVDFYGGDCMLLIGGSLLLAGEGLLERTRAFTAALGVEHAPT